MPGLSAWRPSPIGNGNQLSQYYAPASSASVASHTGDIQTERAHWIWAVGMPATTGGETGNYRPCPAASSGDAPGAPALDYAGFNRAGRQASKPRANPPPGNTCSNWRGRALGGKRRRALPQRRSGSAAPCCARAAVRGQGDALPQLAHRARSTGDALSRRLVADALEPLAEVLVRREHLRRAGSGDGEGRAPPTRSCSRALGKTRSPILRRPKRGRSCGTGKARSTNRARRGGTAWRCVPERRPKAGVVRGGALGGCDPGGRVGEALVQRRKILDRQPVQVFALCQQLLAGGEGLRGVSLRACSLTYVVDDGGRLADVSAGLVPGARIGA
eukprot:scaffold4450_cov113-Isochrysis_galbana.AAC.3